MKNFKRVLAILCIVILAALYLSTLYFALTDNPGTMRMFAGSIITTICLPVFLYIYIRMYHAFTDKKKNLKGTPFNDIPPDSDSDKDDK